ncbi:large ribosomal subunit protein mL38-like [Choristoneura fumiferana]|uniref:large ribosomal subunit protein mL38-like n=1 Tax=Choristoneura fumiferana TaxID=7141 RepID=UPI003D1593C9
MLNTLRKACISNVQLQQVRLGHRVRGKAPIFCRTLKERLDELNYKDELYTTRIDIGFPRPKNSSSELRDARLDHMKKVKSDKNLEQLARNHQLKVNLDEVRNEWLNTLGPHHKKQVAEHYGIFEHLYGEGYFVPFKNLDIFYDLKEKALPVYCGNVIKPSEALNSPTVSYESDGNTMWTLVLSSLDGHLNENDKEYVHWFIANIPGNHIEKGDRLVEYLQPFPLKGTGYHRYVFVLYKQNERMIYDLPQVSSSSPLESRTFESRSWYQKYQDKITPAGLAFYQTDWDSSVKDYFHNVLNMKEPVYEYDFPEPYIKPQKWFPKKEPFNLYMDKYRDPKQINKEYLLRKLNGVDPFQKPASRLRFPNAHALPKNMPSWLKLHEKKIRMSWGRINDV